MVILSNKAQLKMAQKIIDDFVILRDRKRRIDKRAPLRYTEIITVNEIGGTATVMIHETIRTLLVVCPLVFLAGWVDSIAGGGGIIALPAYLFAGLPIHWAYGTNKFASSFGTFFATVRFIKRRQIHFLSAAVSAAAALLGSFLGAKAALSLNEKYLQYLLIILLPGIAVLILTRRNFGEESRSVRLTQLKLIGFSGLIGLTIGAYDGFFGPGTGTFLILANTAVLGFDLTRASGNAKIVNLASNVAAVAAFTVGGKVLFWVGIPAAFCSVLGNWIGSGLALKNGAKVIRPVFIGVLGLLLLKIGIDLWKG
jgi:uncharacterized membrane protein YfcA